MAGGTGDKFETATIVVAGVASLAATLFSMMCVLNLERNCLELLTLGCSDQYGCRRKLICTMTASYCGSHTNANTIQQELSQAAFTTICRPHSSHVSLPVFHVSSANKVLTIATRVPIYSLSSWVSMVSRNAAAVLDPIRDIYEAFFASLPPNQTHDEYIASVRATNPLP